mmetsp:Transcript_17681/g.41075  ORF Transcript_17681/g.41075 Transcript_17681/m.41075 type:complete len:429 (+) Transcript_17681:93-1379(+)
MSILLPRVAIQLLLLLWGCADHAVGIALEISSSQQQATAVSEVLWQQADISTWEARLKRLSRTSTGAAHLFWLFPGMIAVFLFGVLYFVYDSKADDKPQLRALRTRPPLPSPTGTQPLPSSALGSSHTLGPRPPQSTMPHTPMRRGSPASRPPHPFTAEQSGPLGPIRGFDSGAEDEKEPSGCPSLRESTQSTNPRWPPATAQAAPSGMLLQTSARDSTMGAVGRPSVDTRQNLSPSLVVADPSGWEIAVPSDLSPNQQDSVLTVREVRSGAALLRAYVSEKAAESGILLENSQYVPVAFVDTSKAIRQRGVVGRQTGREAVLRLANSTGWDRKTPYCVFFLNTNIYGMTIVARRRSPKGESGPELLSGSVSEDGTVIRMNDFAGRCLAQLDTSAAAASQSDTCIYKVSEGADAGLIVAAAFAARKLL